MDASKVDICTKRGISCSHYMLISHPSWQDMERVVVVLLQTNKAAKQSTAVQVTPMDIFMDTFLPTVFGDKTGNFNRKSNHLHPGHTMMFSKH